MDEGDVQALARADGLETFHKRRQGGDGGPGWLLLLGA